MNYFFIEPEVSGGFGHKTQMNSSIHPPIVHKLHYVFDGWLGDVIVESFPVFLVVERAAKIIVDEELTGAEFFEVEIEKSNQFEDLYPNRELPSFLWFKPSGIIAVDDFSCAKDGRLVISERALNVLRTLGVSHASVEPFQLN